MKPTPKNALPKARVMYCWHHEGVNNPFAGMRQDPNEFYETPCAVLPFRTVREARAAVSAHNQKLAARARDGGKEGT